MKLRRVGAVVCASIAVAGLGACGSDDGESSSTSGTSQTASTSSDAPKGDAIKLGLICSCTGAQKAVLGISDEVGKAWETYINDKGGVNGTPVDLVIKDDGADPAKALQAAKELVEDDQVIGIIATSVADAAFAEYLSGKGVPVVGGSSPEPIYMEDPNFFPSGDTLLALVTGTLAQAEGNKKLGVLYCAESPVCAQLVPLAEAIGSQYGLEVTSAKVSGTQPNYTATCLQMKDQGADALFIAAGGPVVQAVLADCAQQKYTPQNVVQASTTTNTMLQDPALDVSKVAASNANPYDDSTPAVKEFQDALEKTSPGLLDSEGFAYDAIYSWTGGKLFEAAAEAGKLDASSTSEDLKKGLYALKDETLDGWSPPLTFTEGKPFFSPCWFTATIEGGTMVSADGNEPTCLPDDQAAALLQAAAG